MGGICGLVVKCLDNEEPVDRDVTVAIDETVFNKLIILTSGNATELLDYFSQVTKIIELFFNHQEEMLPGGQNTALISICGIH